MNTVHITTKYRTQRKKAYPKVELQVLEQDHARYYYRKQWFNPEEETVLKMLYLYREFINSIKEEDREEQLVLRGKYRKELISIFGNKEAFDKARRATS